MIAEENWDMYGKYISPSVTWAYYTVLFDEPAFSQGGWGSPVEFNPSRVHSILFGSASADSRFDLFVDNVVLLKK